VHDKGDLWKAFPVNQPLEMQRERSLCIANHAQGKTSEIDKCRWNQPQAVLEFRRERLQRRPAY